MKESKALEILKSAILLERRGKAFYAAVAEQSALPTVKTVFGKMAEEEEKHLQALSEQYRAYQKRPSFVPSSRGDRKAGDLASSLFGEKLRKEVSAAAFEAAAIGAAIAMEREALRVYSERAKSATDPEEVELYRWLAAWENDHLDFLVRVDREITEEAWHDARFWPF